MAKKKKATRKKKFKQGILAIDTETTGLDLHHGCLPHTVTTCDDQGMIRWWEWKVDIASRIPIIPQEDKKEIRELIRTSRRLVFHNAKFDIRALRRIDIIRNPELILAKSEDTSLAAHVLHSDGPTDLKSLALYYCSILDDDKDELNEVTKRARALAKTLGLRIATKDDDLVTTSGTQTSLEMMDGWLPKALVDGGYIKDRDKAAIWRTSSSIYAKRDAERTMALWHTLYAQLHAQHLLTVYRERQRLLTPTFDMEERGMTMAQNRIQGMFEHLTETQVNTLDCLNCHGIKNPNSPKQICSCLYEIHKLRPHKYTSKGNPSTDAESLEALSQETDGTVPGDILKNLVTHRKASKTLQFIKSYIDYSIPRKNGEYLSLHPSYKIPGTKTTRFSSHNPNGQNIEKKGKTDGVRNIFGPPPGKVWLSIDYSNIELRIFAYGCQDENLIRAYKEGKSVHLVIAKTLHPVQYDDCLNNGLDFAEVFKETLYQWVKNGNFALIYGASPEKADKTYHMEGAYDRIRKTLPKIDQFIREKHKLVKQYGYITTLGGYRLWVPTTEPHKAVNYYCQGSAGDAMGMALNNLYPYVKSLDGHLIASIHDEVLIELSKDKYESQPTTIVANLKGFMESVGEDLGLPLPVDCDLITNSWAKGEPV